MRCVCLAPGVATADTAGAWHRPRLLQTRPVPGSNVCSRADERLFRGRK
jgi:hypothetical protein